MACHYQHASKANRDFGLSLVTSLTHVLVLLCWHESITPRAKPPPPADFTSRPLRPHRGFPERVRDGESCGRSCDTAVSYREKLPYHANPGTSPKHLRFGAMATGHGQWRVARSDKS
ncbi:hypothetical protein PUN28_002762 [Cardiocondyla obscurior]|uniref:Uncharacterized protein n=1 Tax=Cardiocondyla obscurior TaxID=286306 RepID=A0AAW2GW94_9HYME